MTDGARSSGPARRDARRGAVVALGLAALLALACAGCGAAPTPPTCDLVPETGPLTIEASDRLNPDDDGRPLPTIVRVYQLKGLGRMDVASFDQIWRDASAALGDTLLSVDEVTLYPGQTIVRPFERNPEASFVVGMAVVRKPTGRSWRSVLRMPTSAAALRCLAQQANPESPPGEPPIPQIRFRVEDYQIRGSLRLVSPPAPACARTDLACLQQAAMERASALPETPELPEAPPAPAAPEVAAPPAPPSP